MSPATRIAAAALVAAAFFSSCAGPPGKAAPVFPFKGALREAKPSAPGAFPLTGDIRSRAISPFGSGYLGWDYGTKTLRLLDAGGKEGKSWPLDAAFVWVSDNLVLARGSAFSESAEKGFAFSLYSVGDSGSPRLLSKAVLDCFPADLLFSAPDSVYLAGADREDREHAIYRIMAGAPPAKLLAAPKNADFMRLAGSGDGVLAFASAREKRRRGIEVYFLENGGEAFQKTALLGLPEAALCAYGYGFGFKAGFAIPAAMADGDLALLGIEKSGSGFRVASIAAGAKGCFLPIGPDPSGEAFWYLAHDALIDPDAYFLGRYDGSSATLETID